MVVGAPFDEAAGSVFVYKETDENKWELFGDKIVAADGTQGDEFGYSVDMNEDSILAIGSRVRDI